MSTQPSTLQSLPKVSILIRSGATYYRPVVSPNGKLRPLTALVDGKPQRLPDAAYYLRYQLNGKRKWELVGPDSQLAAVRKLQRQTALITSPDDEDVLTEGESSPESSSLSDSVTEYLDETKGHKGHRTFLAYRLTLDSFRRLKRDSQGKTVAKTDKSGKGVPTRAMAIDQIQRRDIMTWIAEMKDEGLDPRTIANRVANLKTFFIHFRASWPLSKKDKPRFTPKPPSPYTSRELALLLNHATEDEVDLIMFFLGTGCREQEVQYATWRDVSFDQRIFSVTEKNDSELHWIPKDKEQGDVVIPDELVERLRARRTRYPTTRLIFPGADGKPEGHFLRVIKRLALKAGVNCGECINRKGHSCATHPVCRRAILHRLRKSFATCHSDAGVNVRTIQSWLRHSSLDTTLAYLKASDNQSEVIREQVNSSFSHLSAPYSG
jgi:integrase/recombinase XerD